MVEIPLGLSYALFFLGGGLFACLVMAWLMGRR